MSKDNLKQLSLFPMKKDTPQNETLIFEKPLYFRDERTSVGRLAQLALDTGDLTFLAEHKSENIYKVTHESGVSLLAEIKEGDEGSRGTYTIKSVPEYVDPGRSFFKDVNIQGVGAKGWKLRPAQLGAIYSLLSHWSLTNDVATIVLPTGTGKTETMLATTLIDNAKKTLVVVPTIDLKEQIAEKFMTWGMLRKLGVIPLQAPNPTVLVLKKTVTDSSYISALKQADVVISTPALLSRAPENVKNKIKNLFSHVYFDEAHHVVAKEWSDLKDLFKYSKIVQFTATPYRSDRQPIEGKIVYNYPLSQAFSNSRRVLKRRNSLIC
jgi:hypothetical protein